MLPLNCSAPQGPVRWGSPRRRPFLSLSTSKGSGRETSRGSGRETSRGSGWESGRSSDTGSKRQSDSGRRPSGSGRFLVRNSRSYDAAPLTSDVSLLVHADDQLVTDVLCERYAERRVYTRCGADVLLLVTPSKPLDRYFDEAAKSKYRDGRLHELPPHIYLIAEEAYRRVRSMQAVVPIFVVGESGSGKTEAVKELVRYSLWRSSSETGASTSARLLNSIDASFLVLEAFGNARTLTSPNSSRFGLLRRLYVGQSG
ncbi:P-loop containing nucleoside triphosphate hydrolase protein, partial [Pavlovales sp. CCMP2436]